MFMFYLIHMRLIKKGANVNGHCKYDSILLNACTAEKDNVELVQHLLDCGAKVNDREEEEEEEDDSDFSSSSSDASIQCTALKPAVEREHVGIVRLLLEHGAEGSHEMLSFACSYDHWKKKKNTVEIVVSTG